MENYTKRSSNREITSRDQYLDQSIFKISRVRVQSTDRARIRARYRFYN